MGLLVHGHLGLGFRRFRGFRGGRRFSGCRVLGVS